MISRSLKATYYFLLSGPMKLNGSFYRHFRAPSQGEVRVQLGPGQDNYLEGWFNVDANLVSAKRDVWADLRNPLPFRDNSVDCFYSHHVIEHLPDSMLQFHFNEMFRCLKPGGVFRVGGPNCDEAIKRFTAGDLAWFPIWPDERSSIGGRLVNFVFVRNEHLTMLTESYLTELASKAGFKNISLGISHCFTRFPQWFDEHVLSKETDEGPENNGHTILVEAQKLE